ncbi:hypothetical protein A6V39_00710 [Candidatus Mycoplasma haematobovis]|uniref:Uncharacterized protein n=1 Tax=Candidatus Mycoplasma haematobovis TaxID=432608 RepID=A0A1A9QDA5_9MOLU|nr:hypothetical protein [Candidatus Mycoplasma haematobovis]OAL10572.1 hypothetical protein A6V39_00710 [Candidatus Mycoplasma haematobovis]
MPISKAGKIVIGALATGGVSGAGAYLHHILTKPTIKDKLEGTLIGKDETSIWQARVTKLTSDNAIISETLKAINSGGDNKATKIQNWCEINLRNTFISEENKGFKEIQKYCAYNIKEKAGTVIEINSWDNTRNNAKLKDQTNNIQLSPSMSKVKSELTSKQDALKEWCKEVYEKPFKGEKDQDYLDTKAYCVA